MMNHTHMWIPNNSQERYECDYVQCGAAMDWMSKAERLVGVYDAYPRDPDLIRDNVNFVTELEKITMLAGLAQSALKDEHEGRFHEAIDGLFMVTEFVKRNADRM